MNRIEQLLKFIHDNPADEFSRYALGLEYMKLENFTAAENCFQYLVTNHPDYIGTYFQLGKLLEKSERNEEAKLVFKKGMEITYGINTKTYSELQNELTNLELGLND